MARKNPKVAIVHDWLVGGGAELVVEQLHKMYPDAPIYTSYCSDEWRKRLDGKVVTGWLQHLGRVRKFIPFLRIWWFTRLKLDKYDLVISSSGAEAKGIKTNALHVNYCHAPTHYYWSRYEEYMKHPGFGKFDSLARAGLKLLVGPLRKWDYNAAQRPDYIIANSSHIRAEIKKYYGRDATVIFPPVYFERFQKPENQNLPRNGFIISGRQTPYKRFDLAIEACTKLNLSLRVIGSGPDNTRLRSLAGPSVEFLGRISDEDLEKEFASAEALLFPGLDDFGITPVEAMASGTPVIAYKAGGALDYVTESKTGIFFSEQNVDSLCRALQDFQKQPYNHQTIRNAAQRFAPANFQEKMHLFLAKVTK
jgi:glycosyltransferase involved in cell wall biosynthesis